MRVSRSRIVLAAACCLAVAGPVTGAAAQAPPEGAVFRPGLGDLMVMTVQPRHIKLGLAGREGNWAYAAFALHELEESLERVGQQVPRWRNFAIPEMLDAVTKEPMAALEQAIKAGDAARFAAAFGRLTDACNTCHQSADHGMIVIKVPDSSPYPNQEFRPIKR